MNFDFAEITVGARLTGKNFVHRLVISFVMGFNLCYSLERPFSIADICGIEGNLFRDIRRSDGQYLIRLNFATAYWMDVMWSQFAHKQYRKVIIGYNKATQNLLACESDGVLLCYKLYSQLLIMASRLQEIFFFELIATLILVYGFGCSQFARYPSQSKTIDITVAFSYFLALAFCGQVTNGYANPSIFLGSIKQTGTKIWVTLAAQFIGGAAGALGLYLMLGTVVAPFEYQNGKQLAKSILNEFVGTFIMTGIILTVSNKYITTANKSWQVYLMVPINYYLLCKLCGDKILNPAISLPYQLIAYYQNSTANTVIFSWVIVIPSMLGGLAVGYIFRRLYEPLALKFKYEELLKQNL